MAGGQLLEPWKIMIVDDEEDVHHITKLTLQDLKFEGKALEFISAHSAKEAQQLIQEHPDIALILLDVVMEEENAGLKFIKYLREELKNKTVRIILRTGLPGSAPQASVVLDYDINGYTEKTELTRDQLFSITITGLRSYKNLKEIEHERLEILRIENENWRVLESSRMRNNFLNNLSHELRTPLHHISGYIEILKEELEGKLNKDQLEIVDKISNSAHELSKLVEGLLSITEKESNKFDFKFEQVELSTLIEDSIDHVRLMADKKNISLVTELSPDIDKITIDVYFFKQIFYNYLLNAIRFANNNGRVVVRCKKAEKDKFRLEVEDNGTGITTEKLETIFNHFRLISFNDPDKQEDIYSGLAVTKRIVEALHGEVGAQSEIGKGSLFFMVLPINCTAK